VNRTAATRVLRLVGLGVRSRGAIVGVEQVRDAAKKGTLALALVADDASGNSLDKVVPLLEAKRVMIARVASARELGEAVGPSKRRPSGSWMYSWRAAFARCWIRLPRGAREKRIEQARDGHGNRVRHRRG
jgi:ribosomal protein L7Ae-like RNA K-turn-binding protein